MIEKQNTLVIMPARGGSKRIPRKNIKLIGGKQMLRWPLEELLSIFDAQQILVSTEDKEIRKIALEYGISLPYSRPASLADDFVGTREVAVDALQWYETNYRAVDYVLIVYPTAVKLQSAMLKSAFEQIKIRESHNRFSLQTSD
jgi:CMP-N-acetylneuraminic acid synthetase